MAGPDDRNATRPRGLPADPCVHRAVGVHDVDALSPDDPAELPYRGNIPGSAHSHAHRLEPGRPRSLHEAAAGLPGLEDAPPPLPRPARLREGADFLSAQAR